MPFPSRILSYDGHTRTLKEWAEITRIPENTIRSRIDKQGWDIGRALTEPLDARFHHHKNKLLSWIPRPVPEIKRHSTRNLAYVTWRSRGKQHHRYFGKWESEKASRAYQQFAAEWYAGSVDRPNNPIDLATVQDLADLFLHYAESFYIKDGKPTSEAQGFKSALSDLLKLYGNTQIRHFGPNHLRAYVARIIDKGLSLRTVNNYHWRIVFVFNWGVTRAGGLVPPGIVHVLERVEKQIAGRSRAPESDPIRSVPPADIEAVMSHLHHRAEPRAIIEAMIRLQLVSGMRSGELCAMKVDDIDRTRGAVWRYEPRKIQKNRHRGKRRIIWFGPKAQSILTPNLANLANGDRVFAYARNKGGERKAITVNLYRLRVFEACERAGVAPWYPHQLRHNRATELQRIYEDDEAVRLGIGDTPEVARQIYVDDPAEAVAKRIAKETG